MIPVSPLQLRIFYDPVIPSRAHVLLNLGRWTVQGEKEHRIVRAPEEELKGLLGSGLGRGLVPIHWLRSAQSVLVWLLSPQPQLAMNSVPFLDKAAQDLDYSYPTVLRGWALFGRERRSDTSWSFLSVKAQFTFITGPGCSLRAGKITVPVMLVLPLRKYSGACQVSPWAKLVQESGLSSLGAPFL